MSAWITKKKRFAIYARDNYTCAYCGRKYKASRLTIDHITPRKQGGTNKNTNLVTSCDSCNSQKGAMNLGEYIAWCRVNMHVRNVTWMRKRVNSARMRKLVWC